jgi:Trp operon repressor
MTKNTLHTVESTLTYARGVAAGEGTVSAQTWDALRDRLVSLDAREGWAQYARHHVVVSLLVRGVAQKDVASGLNVSSAQVTNMRKSLDAWAQVGLSDKAVTAKRTIATGSIVPVWTLFTNPDRGIRDHAAKSDAWADMLKALPADADDDARIDAVVAYVNAYVKPQRASETFVDKLARVAKAADAGIELSADERAAVAQMLADIAHATGLAQNVAALAAV